MSTVCLSDELREVKHKLVLGVDVKQRQVADAPGSPQGVRHAQLVDLAHVTDVQLESDNNVTSRQSHILVECAQNVLKNDKKA